ncbi:MAG: PLDc N-terminal domain-containing protein [Longimicrobiales bacterium]
MRPWLILLIFLLEAWAIAAVLGSRNRARFKVAWTLGIILLPVVGVLAWVGRGRR